MRPVEVNVGVTDATVVLAGMPVPLTAMPTVMFAKLASGMLEITGLAVNVFAGAVTVVAKDETVVLAGIPVPLTAMPGVTPTIDDSVIVLLVALNVPVGPKVSGTAAPAAVVGAEIVMPPSMNEAPLAETVAGCEMLIVFPNDNGTGLAEVSVALPEITIAFGNVTLVPAAFALAEIVMKLG